jgi:hypothetical protein
VTITSSSVPLFSPTVDCSDDAAVVPESAADATPWTAQATASAIPSGIRVKDL